MENTKAEQLEALETLIEFNDRLLKNLPTIISELTGSRQADTDSYLKTIIDAIGWELSVTNATLNTLNEDKVRLDKGSFNEKVLALNSALSAGSDSEIADALQNLVPWFEQLGSAAREVISF